MGVGRIYGHWSGSAMHLAGWQWLFASFPFSLGLFWGVQVGSALVFVA